MFGMFLWYSRDLPEPGKLVEAQVENSTRIYDRNDIPLYSVYEDVNRTYVKLLGKQLLRLKIKISTRMKAFL